MGATNGDHWMRAWRRSARARCPPLLPLPACLLPTPLPFARVALPLGPAAVVAARGAGAGTRPPRPRVGGHAAAAPGAAVMMGPAIAMARRLLWTAVARPQRWSCALTAMHGPHACALGLAGQAVLHTQPHGICIRMDGLTPSHMPAAHGLLCGHASCPMGRNVSIAVRGHAHVPVPF